MNIIRRGLTVAVLLAAVTAAPLSGERPDRLDPDTGLVAGLRTLPSISIPRATGPARTRRLEEAAATATSDDGAPPPQGVAQQPTKDTEATATIPLVRAGAQCTGANLRVTPCGRLGEHPVN